MSTRENWAYIIGIALGDGNLSNPNGRAIRLRITCDARYPKLATEITETLKKILPRNSVALIRAKKKTYFDISVYSNQLQKWIPWQVGHGTKVEQQAHVPDWIKGNKYYTQACLRGLIQTDGSIYKDRGYLMVNFCNVIEPLATDVFQMLQMLGYRPRLSRTKGRSLMKYTVRLVRSADKFLKEIQCQKK